MSSTSASASKDARRRATRRRRLVRRARRQAVAALLTLAGRAESASGVGTVLRGGAHRLDRAGKRLEQTIGSGPAPTKRVVFEPDPAEAARELRTLIHSRWRSGGLVDQPLVLISQAPRSGGTLLMRLFDGHPQCHAIPHELGALLPSALPLPRDPEQAWKTLTDARLAKAFEHGLRQAKRTQADDTSSYSFVLLPLLHRGLFEQCLKKRRPSTDRGVLDCYLTAYFNGRLDYPGFRRGTDQLWVTGFEPGAIARPKRLACFRALYPDGKIVSVVRKPASWAVSALRRHERYPNLELAISVWRDAVTAALAAREQDPSGVAIVPFESLVSDTDPTMRAVAQFLRIEFREELLTPTFDGVPVKANSSFPVERAGLIDAPLARDAELSAGDRDTVARELGGLYEQALDIALTRP